MDLITVDVSGVAPEHVQPGTSVELIGRNALLDDVARLAGTIGYEILTRLGGDGSAVTSPSLHFSPTCDQLSQRHVTTVRIRDDPFPVMDDFKLCRGPAEYARYNPEPGIPGSGHRRLRCHVLFDDDVAAHADGGWQRLDERLVGVAHHHGQIVLPLPEPVQRRYCRLQIQMNAVDGEALRVRGCVEPLKCNGGNVDGINLPAAPSQIECVASGTAGHIHGLARRPGEFELSKPLNQQCARVPSSLVGTAEVAGVPSFLVRVAQFVARCVRVLAR